MAHPYRGFRCFPYIPPATQSLEPGPFLYRCTGCSNVTRYESFPSGGPGPCSHCGASPLDQRRVTAFQIAESLPPDAGPGLADVHRLTVSTCDPCPYYQPWRRYPTKSCAFGMGQTSYWDAAENRRVRPAFRACFDNARRRDGEGVSEGGPAEGVANVRVVSNYPDIGQWVAEIDQNLVNGAGR
jgi:hypothetical protein